jgi:hypothetical protein
MSLNGLVNPFREKCESLNWRMIRSEQLQPQGLGPYINMQNRCDYSSIAPYTDPNVIRKLYSELPLRIAGYPAVTPCGRMAPLIYYPKIDRNPKVKCGPEMIRWPYGYYCNR